MSIVFTSLNSFQQLLLIGTFLCSFYNLTFYICTIIEAYSQQPVALLQFPECTLKHKH